MKRSTDRQHIKLRSLQRSFGQCHVSNVDINVCAFECLSTAAHSALAYTRYTRQTQRTAENNLWRNIFILILLTNIFPDYLSSPMLEYVKLFIDRRRTEKKKQKTEFNFIACFIGRKQLKRSKNNVFAVCSARADECAAALSMLVF